MAPKNVFLEWKTCLFLLLAAALSTISLRISAQNEVAIGSATTKSNAILWLNGNGSQGLILPVVTNKSAVSGPDPGMIVYDESDDKLWYRSGNTWVEVGAGGGSNANLNLAIQGNQLLLRDGTGILSTVNIAGGTPTAGSFMVFQSGSWQVANGGDIGVTNGALQVNGLRGKTMANLPASTQVLAYDPTANSNNGGWVFQPLSAGGGVSTVSGTAPVTVTNPNTTPNISISNAGITNALLADNAVNSAKIQDGTVTGTDIANNSVTADKLAQSGASNNQVLQWNGTSWVPSTLAAGGTVTQVSTGTGLTGGPITATGTISIASGGVSNTELADNAVSSTKIADNAVTTAKINAAAVDNTKLADNAVTSVKIADGTITGTDIAATTITGSNIANTTVTANKLAQSGATAGQVLKWNGTNWVPQADDSGSSLPALATGQLITNNGTNDVAVTMSGDATFAGTGALTITNNAITTAKIANTAVDATKLADNAVTTAKISANAVDNTRLADNVVTSAKIADGTVTGADIASGTITGTNISSTTITSDKLAQSGAAANQVLQWNGTNWVPGNALSATLNSAQILVGNAGNLATPATVSGDASLTNTGVLTIANDAINSAKISNGSITGTDVAAATITGTNIANTSITADKLAQSGAANGDVLKWNGSNWVPQADATGTPLPVLTTGQLITNNGTTTLGVTMSGDATFSGTGALTIANNAITTAKIANTAVDATKLADNAVTTSKLNAGAVDATKLADNAVITSKIAAGAVDDTKIADNAITNAKIADNAVTSAEIQDATIAGSDIADATITADKLAQSGATDDQVLQWNGTSWTPATLSGSEWSLVGNSGTDPATNFLGTTDLQALIFRTNNSERMRIASNGFVGFGIDPDSYSTTNDAAHIELARTGQHIRFRMTSSFTHRPAIQINATDGTDTRGWSIYRHNNTDGSLIVQANDGINGVNGEIVAMNLEFATGNVGIKKALTDLPTEALDVAGNVRFSGALMPNNLPGTAGQVLTSQGPGVAPVWSSGGGSGWGLLGNAGTTSSNFLGTTDANTLYIRVNNQPSGRIDPSNGENNTFFGFRAGRITTGQANVAVGWNAMEFTTTGEFNTAVGYQALKDNTTAGGNTAIGRSALFTQSANISDNSNNTAIGHRTLYNNQPTNTNNGDENTALGFEAGLANTTGRRNTFLGALAGSSSPATLVNASAIGYNAQVGADNSLVLGGTGGSAVNVGIGTTTPSRRLEVFASGAGFRHTDGTLIVESQIAGSDAWFGTASANHNFHLLAGGFDQMIVRGDNGLIGMGRNPTANKLEVEGNASKTTATAWLANSDQRIKTHISDIENSLETIKRLRPVKFRYSETWKALHPSIKDHYYYNFIAQEYAQVFPESVQSSGEYLDGDDKSILQIDTYSAQITTIKAVQELIYKIEALEKENEKLKADNAMQLLETRKLATEIDAIKMAMGLTSKDQ